MEHAIAGPDPDVHAAITAWFDTESRDLPWREPGCSPWAIMVSEFMLQQTPVARVLPVWRRWLERWPTPADLAAEPSGEAIRHWDRLGYPRRALRLHAAAGAIVDDHDGEVPSDRDALLRLPGVGVYTAAAIASFAFSGRETVLDTNIRRVLARLFDGRALPSPSPTSAESARAARLLPTDPAESVRWNASVMELGALICTARSPACADCPVHDRCAWVAAGSPDPDYVPRGQPWHGTDRQVRGAIMAVLRAASEPLDRAVLLTGPVDLATAESTHLDPGTSGIRPLLDKLHGLGADREQLDRALDGLLADRLAESDGDAIALPA